MSTKPLTTRQLIVKAILEEKKLELTHDNVEMIIRTLNQCKVPTGYNIPLLLDLLDLHVSRDGNLCKPNNPYKLQF